MIHVQVDTFCKATNFLTNLMKSAPQVRTERWQGIDVSKNPAAVSYELRGVEIEVPLRGIEDLDHWRRDIQPNLPWADAHFAERVGGEPLNPAEEWKNWPWGKSANRFRNADEIFNHTYSERLWPRWARRTPGGKAPLPSDEGHRGIAWRYGDLNDLVELLAHEPHTRQAWIPLFFPEDTGVGDGGRKMCSLGYNFLCRDGQLHIWYPLRSVDLIRHFRDDCYLAVRLLLWMLGECRKRNPSFWNLVVPGTYSMHITSLHVFENDMLQLKKGGQ